MNAFVKKCAESRSLHKYEPLIGDPDDAATRCLLLHEDIQCQIALANGSLPGPHKVAIHSQLGSFVKGRRFTVMPTYPPGVKKEENRRLDCDIKGLKYHREIIWSMRFREYHHYRLLGVVAEQDFFVGLLFCPREDLGWNQACRKVLHMYDAIRHDIACTAVKTHELSQAFTKWRIPS